MKIHYVYKIINLKNRKEYIGVRTYSDPENDTYMGSSDILDNVMRLEGSENFKKVILRKFETRHEAEHYESELLTEKFVKSKNTYNLINTGDFETGKHAFRKDIWYDYFEDIREKYTSGTTLHELGTYYNCDKGTVGKVVADMKRTLSDVQKLRFETLSSGARNFEIDTEINEIVSLYEGGYSINKLSIKYNVHEDVIKRRLLENNIRLRTHADSQKLRTDNRKKSDAWNHVTEIKEKYKLKKNYALLSREYSCDLGTIKNIVNSDER